MLIILLDDIRETSKMLYPTKTRKVKVDCQILQLSETTFFNISIIIDTVYD